MPKLRRLLRLLPSTSKFAAKHHHHVLLGVLPPGNRHQSTESPASQSACLSRKNHDSTIRKFVSQLTTTSQSSSPSVEMMLGAQARAAEYNAAKNATARQASHEAEEQKLPPKPAPISLGAYTRNPQVNRNKGTKNWIPLVLPEAEEENETQVDQSEDSAVSSKEQSSTSQPKETTPTGPTTHSGNRIRINMPKAAIPIAPRAMRMQAPPAFPAQHVPPMPHPQPVMHDAGGYIPTALYATHQSTQTVGMLPYSHGGWVYGLPMIDHAGHMSDTPESMRRYGTLMVPTDITPTKQEQKLSTLSQAYQNPLYAASGSHHQLYGEGMMANGPSLHQPYSDLVMVHDPAGDYSLQSIRRPEPLHYHSDLTPEPKTAILYPQASLIRHASLPKPSDEPVTPHRSVSQVRQMNIPDEKENEEPYDRTKKMQNFMAVQQEASKTGKTVLNNPELRKNQEAKKEVEIKEVMKVTPTKTHGASVGKSDLHKMPAPRATPEIPPGLEDVERRLNFIELLEGPSQQNQDRALHETFGVGTDDWLDLKPATRNDRKKMLSVMEHSALRYEKQGLVLKSVAKDPKRLEDINRWLHADTRTLQAARDTVDEIAIEYSTRLYGPVTDEQDRSTGGRAEDIHAGLVRGAGHIMATLTEYIGEREQKVKDTEQDYFNRTRLVPEFAIERSGLGTNLGNVSLFEDEKSGFYNPPHRIARDSRFRPQPQEDVNVKSEEQWAARFKTLAGQGW